ncbi:MAG: stage III sporulation protein AG, partial [Oscillospiraceae bacterium]|nr:stage III sporulation protein AG [Oscillospiraceae bacterium]
EDEIVIIEDDDGEKPIVIRTDEAKIRGVLVICEGGKNPLVREKIIEAVCALFNIPSNKVSVAEMA